MTQTLWADCKALFVPALMLVIIHPQVIWRFAPGAVSLHQGHWHGDQVLHWVGRVTAENVWIQEIILAQTPVCVAHRLIICHSTNNWSGWVVVPNVTKRQYLFSKETKLISIFAWVSLFFSCLYWIVLHSPCICHK